MFVLNFVISGKVTSLAKVIKNVKRSKYSFHYFSAKHTPSATLNFIDVFSLFCNYLLLKKGGDHLIEQTWNPFIQRYCVLSLIEIGPVVLEKKIFKFRQCNFAILLKYYLPLEKGGAIHLNKLESPSPKNALCQVWLKLALWFWGRRKK